MSGKSLMSVQQFYNIRQDPMFDSCKKATSLVFSSYDESALITGISDIVVVKWSDTFYKTSPFLVCFGSLTHEVKKKQILVKVNNHTIETDEFWVNKYGYLQPFHPSTSTLKQFKLKHGLNVIQFTSKGVSMKAEIYLYTLSDKIIISDMDGTMTKTDLRGIYHNCKGNHYLHDGYQTFVRELMQNGYKIIWITMRSIAMYSFSKKYIRQYVGVEGALFPQPEQFFPSLKKEIMKKTGNIKTNMIRMIRELYPLEVNPFDGGLGNRENDAIAYLAVGIPLEKIYFVSKQSQLSTLEGNTLTNFTQLFEEIDTHFPKLSPTQSEKQIKKPKYIEMSLSKKKIERSEKYSIKDFKVRRGFAILGQEDK